MRTKTLLTEHPLLAYFGLAYGITWGGIFLLLIAIGFRFEAVGLPEFGLIFLAMAAGPSTAGLVLTRLVDGQAGWLSLFERMRRWRLGLNWYAISILTNGLTMLAVLAVLSLTVSPAFQPGFMPIGLVFGLLAGFFEEIGWTGFALPRLQSRFNTLAAGLVLGLLWSVWHMLADYSGNIHAMGSAWFVHFLIYWIAPLTAYRILMAWVYKNTESLLLAQVMHAGYTGVQALFTPTSTTLAENLIWQAAFAVALWLIVAVAAVTYGKSLARRYVMRNA
jgi:membrane protease YdiL (CAAX protease family)